MSQDVFSKCVALSLKSPIDRDDLYDTLYDYLDDTYGSHVYSIRFGSDFVALYYDKGYDEHYGITRVDSVMDEEFSDLYPILAILCEKHEIDVELQPKYFTDFWYNGTDPSVTNTKWEEL